MRILMVSGREWNKNNSFGSTYSSIFESIHDLQFVFIRRGFGGKDDVENYRCFQITERSLLKNLLNPSIPTGKEIDNSTDTGIVRNHIELKTFNIARVLRFQVFFWLRDLIWAIGRWKSQELSSFLDDAGADIMFQPIGISGYANDMITYVKKRTGIPMIGYISDDCYSLNQFNLSPLYWIDRIWKRKKVKKSIEQCSVLYVVSQLQKEEYEKIFNVPCKVLTKSMDFSKEIPKWSTPKGTIRLFYAGVISSGRLASLSVIAKALVRLNKKGIPTLFSIYTQTPITTRMKKCLNIGSYCSVNGPISAEQVKKLQEDSDILVHVEGLSLKERKLVRQSFSTKLVDYFSLGKAIFAYGPNDVASTKNEVYAKLYKLCSDQELLRQMGRNAYLCGRIHHDKNIMTSMVVQDINTILSRNEKSK